jgi:WD40 repeat protein
VRTGKCTATFTGHQYAIWSVAISTDNSFIVTGSMDSTAQVWDAHTGEYIATLTGHRESVTSVAISPDNSLIVTGSSDCAARVWDAHTGKCLATLSDHDGWVTSVAISTDNSFIVTAHKDNAARMWSLAQIAIGELTFNEALAFTIMTKAQAELNPVHLLSFLNQLSIHELYFLAACLAIASASV